MEPEAVRDLVADTTVAMHRATAPEPRKEIALADLDGLRRRVERLPARPAILHALFAAGAFVVRKGSRKQPLLAEARKLADQLIERHGPEQAKQLVLGVVVEAAKDRTVRDVGAVIAHRVQRQAHAVAPNVECTQHSKAPPQAHRAAWSRLIGAHGAGDTTAFAKALRQLVEVNVTLEQIAERIGITSEALHAHLVNETTRRVRTA